jgi:colicin import membrane protein
MAHTIPPAEARHFRSPLITRSEPGKIPAAVLALLVHSGFFALLVFGVSWQVKHAEVASAELWSQMPPIQNVPVVVPPEPEVVKRVEQVEPESARVEPKIEKALPVPRKADIQLQAKREKLEKAEREKKLRDEKLLKEKQLQEVIDKKRKAEELAQKAALKLANDKAAAEQAEREAAVVAARTASLKAYSDKIAKLIRDRASIPDSVTGKPEVQVRLRLLVNGVIFDASVVKPSGDSVYDASVERAVNGIRNWPQPDNPELFGGRRELILNIRHER